MLIYSYSSGNKLARKAIRERTFTGSIPVMMRQALKYSFHKTTLIYKNMIEPMNPYENIHGGHEGTQQAEDEEDQDESVDNDTNNDGNDDNDENDLTDLILDINLAQSQELFEENLEEVPDEEDEEDALRRNLEEVLANVDEELV